VFFVAQIYTFVDWYTIHMAFLQNMNNVLIFLPKSTFLLIGIQFTWHFYKNMNNVLKGYVSTTRRYVPPFHYLVNDAQWGQIFIGVAFFPKPVKQKRYL
jgi:hypothetical protein